MSPATADNKAGEQPGPIYDRGVRTLARLDPGLLIRTAGVAPQGRVQALEATFPGATLVPDGLFRTGPG